MLTPVRARAQLYLPPGKGGGNASENVLKIYIREYHLDAPYPVQYVYWIKSLLQGSWGWSPSMRMDVLPALLRRTPATLELTFYSLLIFIPLGLASGVISGWKPYQLGDNLFRTIAFVGMTVPPFILALFFLSLFYVKLGWFAPERLGYDFNYAMAKGTFHTITGFLTIDSLLNARLDFFVDALRHLAMPVITLSLYNWAVLARITRSTIIEQRNKEFIISARARGLKERRILWKHAFRSVLAPSLTSIGLSAATILTGAFIVEIIYNMHGVSEVLTLSMQSVPDAPAALGFAVYSVVMVLTLMLVIDVLQAILDPRIREEVLKS
jgi:peptide/nickel transport system permease protein